MNNASSSSSSSRVGKRKKRGDVELPVIDYENFNHESNLYDIDARHMLGRTVKIGKAYFDTAYQNLMEKENRTHDEQTISIFIPKQALIDDKNNLDRHALVKTNDEDIKYILHDTFQGRKNIITIQNYWISLDPMDGYYAFSETQLKAWGNEMMSLSDTKKVIIDKIRLEQQELLEKKYRTNRNQNTFTYDSGTEWMEERKKDIDRANLVLNGVKIMSVQEPKLQKEDISLQRCQNRLHLWLKKRHVSKIRSRIRIV